MVIAGVAGLLIDYLQDFNIKPENSGLFLLAIGTVLLVVTAIVFIFAPAYQRRQRTEQLRQYYMRRPEGEVGNIRHDIVDTAQAVIWNIESMAFLCDECSREKEPPAECKSRLSIARQNLGDAKGEIEKLDRLVEKLRTHVHMKG